MANPWFRFHAEFLHDPKVRVMSDSNQLRLVLLFCIRCNGDVTLQDNHVTFSLRISDAEWQQTKAVFIESGFIDSDNKVLNWDKRQYISDSSAARVAKHRALHKPITVTQCNVTVTPPEQIQNRTDTNKKAIVASDAGRPSCPHKEIIKLYHQHLPTMPVIRVWTEGRKKKLMARWREDEKRQGIDFWDRFFKYVAKSDFLCGRTEKPFNCDFEWMLNAANFVKIIEGKYHAG